MLAKIRWNLKSAENLALKFWASWQCSYEEQHQKIHMFSKQSNKLSHESIQLDFQGIKYKSVYFGNVYVLETFCLLLDTMFELLFFGFL